MWLRLQQVTARINPRPLATIRAITMPATRAGEFLLVEVWFRSGDEVGVLVVGVDDSDDSVFCGSRVA